MASAEHLLISKVIQTKDLTVALKSGVKEDHFTKEWSKVWSWVVTFWRDHGEVPSKRALSQEFGDIRLISAEDEPFTALIDEVYNSYRHRNA